MRNLSDAIFGNSVGSSLVKLVARGAFVALSLQLTGLLVSYFNQLVLARWMGVAAYGTYAYATAWATLLAVASALGLDVATLRFIPSYIDAKAFELARGFMSFASKSITIAGLVLGGILAAVSLTLARGDWVYAGALAVAAWMVPLTALGSLRSAYARAIGALVPGFGPLQVLKPALLLGLVGAIYALTGKLTAETAVSAGVVALAIATVTQWTLVRKRVKSVLGNGKITFKQTEWRNVALPLLLVNLFLVVMNQSDVLMVGSILGPKDAGIYAVASRFASLVGFLLIAINTLAAPTYARLHATGSMRELQYVATRLAHIVFWPSLAIAAGLMIAGNSILGWFGPGFKSGWNVLAVLVLGQLANAGAGSVGYLTELTGLQVSGAWVRGIGAALNVALNLVLIPVAGILGAAMATTFTMVMWNVWLHFIVAKRVGVHASILSALIRQPQKRRSE